MTGNRTILRLSLALLASASAAGLAASASAEKILFSSDPALVGVTLARGQEIRTTTGTTQIMTDSGSIVSIVGAGALKVDGDDVTILSGSATVAAPRGGTPTRVLLPGGASARLVGDAPSGSFTVEGDSFTGNTLGGAIQVSNGARSSTFRAGAAWQGSASSMATRVFANAAAAAPAAAASGDTAQAAAAGIPVNLGEALAAAGASGDVVQAARSVEAAATNPAIPSFPAGDVATLVDYAAQLQTAFGGQAFAGAEPAIIQTYLTFLASGGASDQFKATYAALINQYIDLLRTGAAPSSFTGAAQTAVNAYLGFLSSTGALQSLSAQNKALAEAYLSFLSGGGAAADFTASYTNVINAYLDFIKSGGTPSAFTGATQEVITAYFAFLQSSGLADAIAAQNRAVFDAYAAYLANGGTGVFVPPGGSNPTNPTNPGTGPVVLPEYAAALQAYIDFIKGGGNPNQFQGITADLLRQYINAAIDAGLFAGVPEANIQLIRNALDLLQSIGTLDSLAAILASITLTLPNVPTTPTSPTNPTTPTTPVAGAQLTNQITAYAGSEIGIDARDKTTVTVGDAGQMVKYLWTTAPTDEAQEIGSNSAPESGSVAGVIGWTRWAGGATAGIYYNVGPVTRGDKSGLHFVYGTPATNVPTSGTSTYALIGSTKPTISNGSVDPGTFTGSAAVAFGSTAKVGLDLHVAIGGHTYDIATTGGVANPGQSQIGVMDNMAFSGYGISLAAGGPACPGGTCNADITGFLAGPGASHLGLSYMISAQGNGGGLTVTGAAAFGK